MEWNRKSPAISSEYFFSGKNETTKIELPGNKWQTEVSYIRIELKTKRNQWMNQLPELTSRLRGGLGITHSASYRCSPWWNCKIVIFGALESSGNQESHFCPSHSSEPLSLLTFTLDQLHWKWLVNYLFFLKTFRMTCCFFGWMFFLQSSGKEVSCKCKNLKENFYLQICSKMCD